MTIDDPTNVTFRHRLTRLARLASELGHRGFRHSFMARQLKAFLAQQIRALRGDLSQTEFGERIGKPQSVVSRLEKQADRHISVQTLIDIAERLDIAVIIRFVNFPTFFRYTEDYSDAALKPEPFRQEAIDEIVSDAEQTARGDTLKGHFFGIPVQISGPSVKNATPPPLARHPIGAMSRPPANDTGVLSGLSAGSQSAANSGAAA